MLVKCPKCGFDQPKDTYCASCGIEMESYRPVKVPLWKRVLKSPLFSLILFLGLGYGALLYLKNPSQFQALNSSPRVSSGEVKNSGAITNNPTPSPTSPPPEMQTPPTQTEQTNSQTSPSQPPTASPTNATLGGDIQPSLNDGGSAIEESTEPAQKTINIESIKGPLELEIRFIEAPNSVVQQFHSEASDDAGGDSGDMNYAIVKNSSKWLRFRSFAELDRFTKKVPAVGKKLQWFSGFQEPTSGAPFGLNFQISVQERTGGHLAGDLFISRSIVEHNEAGALVTQRKEFMTRYETDVGSLIGISGVMPHLILKTEEKDWLQDSLLKIFLSPAYLQGESELLILLQFKSDSK
jgi:hypothetical protein